MFSSEDIRDLVRLFPLETVFEKAENNPYLYTENLLPSLSGNGFLIASKVLDQFRSKAYTGIEQISVSSLSRELDIAAYSVLDLVNQSHHLALLSGDKDHVVPKGRRDLICDQLRCLLARQFVSKKQFADEHNIALESIDALVTCLNDFSDTKSALDLVLEVYHPTDPSGPYLCSSKYRTDLGNSISKTLNEACSQVKIVCLASDQFPGSPPCWYVSQIADQLLAGSKGDSTRVDGQLKKTGDNLIFKPTSLCLIERDEIIHQLQTGKSSHVALSWFTEELPELYSSYRDSQSYVQSSLSGQVDFLSGYAISQAWLQDNRRNEQRNLAKVGYIDISDCLSQTFPPTILSRLVSAEKEKLLASFEASPKASSAQSLQDYILRTDYLEGLTMFILDAARNQAKAQWAKLDQSLEHECTLHDSEILDGLVQRNPEDQKAAAVLRAVFHDIEPKARTAFMEEIAGLESINEAEFSAFWVERVVARIQVYKSGADTIQDAKLRSQLLELLQTYIVKELVPDAITRAQSKGLLRSRKTKRQANKFNTILGASTGVGKATPDLQNIITSIEKFMKKQSVEWLDCDSLAEKKSAQVKDLVRGMQKDTDGPRLFLTLVVILLANRQDGVVYATGKFAPKLMKLLKASLGSNEYERLEGWKDAVKAAILTAEDKEGMRAWAIAG
ncbi:hypothetical protein K432DRAFT_426459 [Lepidopterella palustris CBS 459.81]|uniref:Uncharacterized protein n=1 Tax=Lepidopterella palustris CBS 459.81 TaxID=1314670 RepID=A0A8E2E8Q8_9PEZI|nr:hypothetical protein K432DRAFT_426459 [Lepidopterella palustris CBS 459.81]